MYIRRLNTFFEANRGHKNTICSFNARRTLCDGSPDLWDGQPLPPETVGDAASHAPAPVLHRGGLSVGPPPTELVHEVEPDRKRREAKHVHNILTTCSKHVTSLQPEAALANLFLCLSPVLPLPSGAVQGPNILQLR